MKETLSCCILSPYSEQKGGAELSLQHLLQHGGGHGVIWSVAFLQDGPMREIADKAGLATTVLGITRMASITTMPRGLLRLRRFLREQQADVVLGWVSHMAYLTGLAARTTGVRGMWFQKGAGSDFPGWRRHLAVTPMTGLLANSHATARRQAELTPTLPIHVVPSAVELSAFDPAKLPSPSEARASLGLPSDGPLLGMVGRLQRWKGFHTLIEALALVHERHPDARVLVVGGPHETEPYYEHHLQALAKRLGVANRVHFSGTMPHHRIPLAMQACDVIVHASKHEPFGIVIVEALALGKPTIASTNGGPAEIIRHNDCGLLVPPDQPSRLCSALDDLLRDRARCCSLANQGRIRAREFSVDRFRDRMAQAMRFTVDRKLQPRLYVDGKME